MGEAKNKPDAKSAPMPKSMRISEETKKAFDGIAKEIGGNHDRTMRALIDAYETVAFGELYPDSKGYLKDVLAHTAAIEATIKSLIAAKETAETAAQERVREEMVVKDRIIADYQKQVAELDDARKRAADAEARADKSEETIRNMEDQIESHRVLSMSVAEVDSLRVQLAKTQTELAAVRASLAAKEETIRLFSTFISIKEAESN